MGRRAHRPDPAQRRQVEALAAYGIPEADISGVVGIDPKTLRIADRMARRLGMSRGECFCYAVRWYFALLEGGRAAANSVEASLSKSAK